MTVPLAKANILVVDDTTANLDLLTALLESNGYLVRPAISGGLALAAIQNQRPDLILLDIMMPEMNGFEVCERLKADSDTAGIPVIFISALNETEDIVHAFEVGGSDYITKPFKRREVLARIENQLTVITQRDQIINYYERLDRMKQQFIRSATHDLKNPLHVIYGYAAILEDMDGPAFERSGREFVEQMYGGIRKMQALITDMLELAQLQTGANVVLERVDLGLILQQVAQNFLPMAAGAGISLELALPPEPLPAQVDEKRIERALDNLVSNALKYTLPGGRVLLNAVRMKQQVVVSVQDTGLGIPEESLPHLFETFYRVPLESHIGIEGTGLGLSIVKALVEQNGGRVEVESTLDEGSTFFILLPLAES
ncbi:MAG: response regulator [Anaerolineae bacterium]|nr:response regulator [Anaerolineae bacterium]